MNNRGNLFDRAAVVTPLRNVCRATGILRDCGTASCHWQKNFDRCAENTPVSFALHICLVTQRVCARLHAPGFVHESQGRLVGLADLGIEPIEFHARKGDTIRKGGVAVLEDDAERPVTERHEV